MKFITEESSTSSGAAGIKTRLTVTPGPGDVTANDDFGYTESFEYFNDNIDVGIFRTNKWKCRLGLHCELWSNIMKNLQNIILGLVGVGTFLFTVALFLNFLQGTL